MNLSWPQLVVIQDLYDIMEEIGYIRNPSKKEIAFLVAHVNHIVKTHRAPARYMFVFNFMLVGDLYQTAAMAVDLKDIVQDVHHKIDF